MLVKTLLLNKTVNSIEKITDTQVDIDKAIKNLSEMIQCKTISNPNPDLVDWKEFDKLRKYIQKSYPLVHKHLRREVIAQYSLMYTWQGTDESLEPLALLAHQDVVPVMPGTEGDWEQDAFSGRIDEQFVWGRGTLDMKHQLVCILESIETMLEKNIIPKRTVYLCFGHNEEVVGSSGGGAQEIAQTLLNRGVRLGCVIDEGGAVVDGKTFGIDGDIAMVGVCEKGYADIKITAHHDGGHASQPPKNNGLVQVCDAIVKLEKNQFKKRLIKPVEETFLELGKHMGFGMQFVLANLWLTKPLLLMVLSKSRLTNAMIRTTIAPTMAEGSPAGNVLPQTANISVNFRVLQGEKIEDVMNHIKKTSKNKNLELELLRGKEPSAISPMQGYEIDIIKITTRQLYGNIPIAPYLMVGGTDSCYFECVTDNIYCISPFKLETSDLKRIHGTNEKILKSQIENGVKFFIQLINNYCM
ncbi:MAG: M20 family peptidase [Clostridiales bacterium]|nr:M20 family peptidase [Clostridiales bacterium]